MVEHLIRMPKAEWSKIVVSSRRELPNYWIGHHCAHLGPVPLTEEIPRYEDNGLNFYHTQDYMLEIQNRRASAWSYNIIRPNGIVGFTPHSNGMSEALTVALYFFISRELGGDGLFPGNEFFYDPIDEQSYAPSIADMSVRAANDRAVPERSLQPTATATSSSGATSGRS
ncbi:putative nucleoside-diphosphate-sugar epimerase [Diplodia seriata]|uniref:Putative nucleoside-diphosphate-sugar epimerase n=1 Tax=Diplodia seriata TaxID=420778 RepID=A0A0G2E5K9_9PEZI|nr:putative nucleoside-diphosphate-sugar epimerase [Diplodia seriata]